MELYSDDDNNGSAVGEDFEFLPNTSSTGKGKQGKCSRKVISTWVGLEEGKLEAIGNLFWQS